MAHGPAAGPASAGSPAAPAPTPTPTPFRFDVTADDVRSSAGVVARAFGPVLAGLTVVVAVLGAVVLPDDHGGSLADWLQTAIVVLALALGGRLVVDGSVAVDDAALEATLALRVVPLVVTLVVLGLVARATVRAERQSPSVGPRRLLTRSAVTGVVAGVVAGLLALLGSTSTPYGLDLGEEFDVPGSVEVGAGAIGTFLGVVLLVGATAALARVWASPASRMPLPAAVAAYRTPERTADLRVVLRVLGTFAIGLLTAAAVGLVVAFLYQAYLTDDLDGDRLAVFGGLVALGVNAVVVLALGALGVPAVLSGRSEGSAELMEMLDDGIGANADRSFGLTDNPWLLLVLLVPVAIALGTAVRRSLRGTGTVVSAQALQLAAGIGAATGLAAALLVRVAASGEVSAAGDPGFVIEVSGSAGANANPSLLWAPLLGAAWAAAVVWAMRLGPTLALSLPERVTRLLAGRGIRPEWAAALAGTAPAPAGRRSPAVRLAALVTAAAVVLAAVGAAVVAVLNATVFTPRAAAEAYLDAIADGDVAVAVAQLAEVPELEDQAFLSDAVLGSDDFTPISDVTIGSVRESGDSATVDVTYVLDGEEVADTISLTAGDDRLGFLRDWQVAESLPTVESYSDSSLGREIAGVGFPATGSYLALPGRYTVHAADHALLTSDDSSFVVTTDSAGSPSLSPEIRPEVLDRARDAVDEAITTCAQATELPLEDCPFLTGHSWLDDLTDVQITVTEQPEYSLEYDESVGGLVIVGEEFGEVTLTGTETVDFFFSEPEERPYESSYSFRVNGEVTASGDDLDVTFD
ncbi:hypothetical protein ACI79C_05195 [Geodermatophilus sp. SYSU D00697]